MEDFEKGTTLKQNTKHPASYTFISLSLSQYKENINKVFLSAQNDLILQERISEG
jgi:hypothetical protein